MAENYLYDPPTTDDTSYLALTANLKKIDLTCDRLVPCPWVTQPFVSLQIEAY